MPLKKTHEELLPVDYHELSNYETRQSRDQVKTDLELTCNRCGLVVCDVEPEDTLDVLARTAMGHAAECPEKGES